MLSWAYFADRDRLKPWSLLVLRKPPMPLQIALLRAVNLGSHNKVGMAELRGLFEELGYTQVQSVLQTGNLVFEVTGRASKDLATTLRNSAREKLGLDTDFFVRNAKEWQALVSANPFPKQAQSDPSHLVLMPLSAAPGAAEIAALKTAIVGREAFHANGRDAYFYYPDGIGRSKLSPVLIERKLQVRGTARNWNTVLKLAALL